MSYQAFTRNLTHKLEQHNFEEARAKHNWVNLKSNAKGENEERLRYRGLWTDLDLVFPSTTGTIMRRNNLHCRSYKPLLKRAGLPNIRLYDLRHTFATLMFENREQLKLVSEMLGHASMKQTADT